MAGRSAECRSLNEVWLPVYEFVMASDVVMVVLVMTMLVVLIGGVVPVTVRLPLTVTFP